MTLVQWMGFFGVPFELQIMAKGILAVKAPILLRADFRVKIDEEGKTVTVFAAEQPVIRKTFVEIERMVNGPPQDHVDGQAVAVGGNGPGGDPGLPG